MELDLRKQRAIQILKQNSIKAVEDGWIVKSQYSKRYYYVDRSFICNCPDTEFNGEKLCKHSHAVRYFIGVEKPNGTTEKVRITMQQAWHAYNEAQTSEIKMFDELLC